MMDIRKVKKLIEMLEESSLAEIEIHEGEESIRISRASSAPAPVSYTASPAPVAAAPAAPTPEAPAAPATPTGHSVKSPMVGTFYRASSPGAKPFVEEGMQVSVGDTLCIIEAMKLFNEIESEVSGKIVKVLIDNATPIEYDQPLFLVDPAG